MSKLKDRINEREMRRTGGTPERASFHSKGYHKYFEGYSEYREVGKDGKEHIKRVYTGVYHTPQLDDKKRTQIRTAYVLLALISAVGYVLLITRPLQSNSALYSAAAQALTILSIFWLAWSLFNYLTAGKNMTMGEFRYTTALAKSAWYTFLLQLATALATVIHAALHLAEAGAAELVCALGFALCALCCLAINRIEENISYDSFLSDAEVTSLDAQQITSDD